MTLDEKYRPESLDDVIGQDDIVDKIRDNIQSGDVSDMLFSGSPGVGKTSTAIALTKDMYGEAYHDNFKELNASDDRGIDAVRDQIKDYAKANFNEKRRIIFLDEADSLTDQAQSALRRTMETYTSNCIFILSCNYKGKIIPAIQSRCTVYNYREVDDEDMYNYLVNIADKEEFDITKEAIKEIVRYAEGDVRKGVLTLDQMAIGEGTTEKDVVVKLLPIADPDDVQKLIQLCVDGEFNKALDFSEELMYEKGLTARNIIDEINDVVWDIDVEDQTKVAIANCAGEADFRINEGATEKVQISGLLATVTQLGDEDEVQQVSDSGGGSDDDMPEIFQS